MCGRPNLYTSYSAETSMLPTWTQRVAMALLVVVAVLLPFNLPVINQLPFVRFLGDPDWIRADRPQAVIFAVAALGLNLLTGVAGQVSLGHAFFMGVGAYTAVVPRRRELGAPVGPRPADVDLAARRRHRRGARRGHRRSGRGPRAAACTSASSPSAWCSSASTCRRCSRRSPGGREVGRNFPPLEFKWWKEEEPVISFADDGHWLWFDITGDAEDATCSRWRCSPSPSSSPRTSSAPAPGGPCRRSATATSPPRSWACPRSRYKMIAFAVSSFFAGVAGAVFASFVGRLPPEYWDLVLSVEFIAIILIGGAGTTAGALLGTFFVVLLPRILEDFVQLDERAGRRQRVRGRGSGTSSSAPAPATSGSCPTPQIAPGFPLPSSALDAVLYGALIIIFLLFEPRGLFGIWIRIRNYWKGWPFRY